MPARLQVTPSVGEPFELIIGNTATIGRTSDNTICLHGSPLVSRQHALLRCHDGYRYQLIDLGSRNGTFVDDQRVVMPTTLSEGARIRLLIMSCASSGSRRIFLRLSSNPLSLAPSIARPRPFDPSHCWSATFAVQIQWRKKSLVPTLPSISVSGSAKRETSCRKTAALSISLSAMHSLPTGALASRMGPDCAATLRIARELLALAATVKWSDGQPFRVGIALHYGVVTCGNVGLDAQRDATIIGDAVNTVFRLESLMKEFGSASLLSADFREHLVTGENFIDFGERKLKGKRAVRCAFTVWSELLWDGVSDRTQLRALN